MESDWYDLSTKAIGFVWSLIGLVCVFVGLAYTSETVNDTSADLLVYIGNVILLGGLALAFSIDEIIERRDWEVIGGYTVFVVGSFVLLFGILSLLDSLISYKFQWGYPMSLPLIILVGFLAVLLGMVFLSSPEPVRHTIFLLELGAAAVVSYSFLIMVISRPPLALFVALATLLGAVFVDNLLKGNDLEIHKKIAVSLSIPLALILFTNTVFLSPLLALVVLVVAVAVVYLLWIAEPTGYDLLSLTTSTERKIALVVAIPLVLLLFANYVILTPAYDDTTMKVGPDRSCPSPNGEYYYPQTYTSVEQNTEQIPRLMGNKPLEIAEEEYGIKNPKLIDKKPRRIKFARETIDVEKRYNPNRYYVIEGGSFDKKHLLIVREGLFASGTRLVQFKSDIC